MGIGEKKRTTSKEVEIANGYTKFEETEKTNYGLSITRTRTVYASPWVETVTQCYCCTCTETEYGMLQNDAACRNHGFAGQRPCDIHNLPGKEWDEEIIPAEGTQPRMPMTVLEVRRARELGQPTH